MASRHDPTRFVVPALAVGLLAACTAATFERDVGYGETAISRIEAALNATPKGKAIVAWFEAEKEGALAAAGRFNASLPGGGLTLEDVKFGCAADETVHDLISAAEWVVAIPSQAVKADDLGYAAIQGACKLATAGKLPSTAAAGTVVGMFNDTAVALGIKK